MKELSIEQKAKRYDEAKYIMKEYLESGNAGVIAENTIKNAFPELKESEEDEKIRKTMINGFNKLDKSAVWYNGITNGQILAWLEKQEQKPTNTDNKFIRMRETKPKDISEFLDRLTTVEQEFLWEHIAKIRELDKEEQKHAQGKLSEMIKNLKPLNEVLEQKHADSYCQENCKGFQETGKCFADGECKAKRDAEQKTAWSEEDEYHKRQILRILKDNGCSQTLQERTEKWIEEKLKSLRPQKQWKPSEEQLKSLKEVIDVGHFTSYPNALEILYEQLKKLRG